LNPNAWTPTKRQAGIAASPALPTLTRKGHSEDWTQVVRWNWVPVYVLNASLMPSVFVYAIFHGTTYTVIDRYRVSDRHNRCT